MSAPIQQADYDFLARKLGYGSMKALQDERLAEERAREVAVVEARERERLAEIERTKREQDQEISDGLLRMHIYLDSKELPIHGLEDLPKLACPKCILAFPWARELVLQVARRSSYHGPEYRPGLHRPDHRLDAIGAGADRLQVIPEVLRFQGQCHCPECGSSYLLDISAKCQHDGLMVRGL